MTLDDTATGGGALLREVFDHDVEARLIGEDTDEDYFGWFCVATAPFPCPAGGCDFVALHMTAAHLIVVWPRVDDVAMLQKADAAKAAGRQPRVVEYQPAMGPCVAYDMWRRIGSPVHGMLDKPPGWKSKGWQSA